MDIVKSVLAGPVLGVYADVTIQSCRKCGNADITTHCLPSERSYWLRYEKCGNTASVATSRQAAIDSWNTSGMIKEKPVEDTSFSTLTRNERARLLTMTNAISAVKDAIYSISRHGFEFIKASEGESNQQRLETQLGVFMALLAST